MRKIFVSILIALLSLNAFSIDAEELKSSLKSKQFNNTKIEVLRVKKNKIKSPAKEFILIAQNELETCYKILKKQGDISPNLSNISKAIQDIQETDTNWPIDVYVNEMTFLQKQMTITTPSSTEKQKQEKKVSNPKNVATKTDIEPIQTKQLQTINHTKEVTPNSDYKTPSVSVKQPIPLPKPALSNTSQQKKSSPKNSNSSTGSDFIIVILVIVLVIAGILWIMANMHLFFGGALALLIFLIYIGYSKNDFTVFPPSILWSGIVGDIILWIICYRYSTRCDKCKKWGAMKTISKELVSERASSITKKLEKKNRQGEVIGTQEVVVPATVYTYHVHRCCSKCGHRDYLVKTSKREN
ncbi:MAG: hypothetical protein K2I90_05915 [Odoribacter sp.]|nr:hypothetical protein [Odoribacter sp.]